MFSQSSHVIIRYRAVSELSSNNFAMLQLQGRSSVSILVRSNLLVSSDQEGYKSIWYYYLSSLCPPPLDVASWNIKIWYVMKSVCPHPRERQQFGLMCTQKTGCVCMYLCAMYSCPCQGQGRSIIVKIHTSSWTLAQIVLLELLIVVQWHVSTRTKSKVKVW